MKRIRLDSKNLSLVFSITPEFGVEYLYFGPKKSENYNFKKYNIVVRDRCGVSFAKPIFSTFGGYEHHEYSHIIKNSSGAYSNSFVFKNVNLNAKKNIPTMPSGRNETKSISFLFEDKENKEELEIIYSVYEDSDIFSCYSVLRNKGNEDIHILKASSLSFPINETDFSVATFNGSWAHERNRNETKLTQGLLINSSVNGSSSHLHNPLTLLRRKNGNCFGFNLIYGGNHKTSYEAGFVERMNVIVGINDFLFDWKLESGKKFVTPEAVFTYGNNDNEVMHHFHDFIHTNIMRKEFSMKPRPIVFNNWEGTYFDFNSEKIEAIASTAAELGGELFVLDDGWFGERNSDTSSLGDWTSNKVKTGGGLDKLSKKVKDLGLKFGIWIEPEMISPNSNLYRAHPNWAMEIKGRKPTLWRNQLMLDITNPEVKEYVIQTICNVIDEASADYVKWDYNRQMTEIYGKDFPTSEYFHRYMLSFYEIANTVFEKYPNVLWEGCAGGGGRFDLGMLYYFSQIWTSDDTDPRERILIQDGTLMGYPQNAITAHVSKSPIETTKRTVSLSDRYNVSLSMNLGYELDPTKFSEDEKIIVKKQISNYKQIRDFLQLQPTYRIVYKDKLKGVLTGNSNEAYLFLYLLEKGNFDVKLPQIFEPDASYDVDGKSIVGSLLNKNGLPKEFYDDLKIDEAHTCMIGTKVLHIKRN